MTRALVTGAAGFIGSHVAEGLVARGDRVTGLDNFDPFYPRPLKEANLAPLRAAAGFTFVEGDVRDTALLRGLLDRDTVVVHLAALAGVRPSIERPADYVAVNVDGTLSVLEAARTAGARAFVFGSSSSVYGERSPVPFREDVPAADPISPYAATKRAGELLCATYAHLFAMRMLALRFFTVYGPRQRPDLAIHAFTRLLAAGRPVPRYGDGSSERDYTDVSDIVQGVLAAVEWVRTGPPVFDIVNLGESRTTRLDRLIALVAAALGVAPRIEERPMQPGDVHRTFADVTKAQRLLGYRPATSVEDGIPRFVRWYEETHGRQA